MYTSHLSLLTFERYIVMTNTRPSTEKEKKGDLSIDTDKSDWERIQGETQRSFQNSSVRLHISFFRDGG